MIKLSNVNWTSFNKPASFSLTTMADVECLEKMDTIPSLMSINSLILEVMSIISKFFEVLIFIESVLTVIE